MEKCIKRSRASFVLFAAILFSLITGVFVFADMEPLTKHYFLVNGLPSDTEYYLITLHDYDSYTLSKEDQDTLSENNISLSAEDFAITSVTHSSELSSGYKFILDGNYRSSDFYVALYFPATSSHILSERYAGPNRLETYYYNILIEDYSPNTQSGTIKITDISEPLRKNTCLLTICACIPFIVIVSILYALICSLILGKNGSFKKLLVFSLTVLLLTCLFLFSSSAEPSFRLDINIIVWIQGFPLFLLVTVFTFFAMFGKQEKLKKPIIAITAIISAIFLFIVCLLSMVRWTGMLSIIISSIALALIL